MNAVHAQDVFELPMLPLPGRRPSFARTTGKGGIDRPLGRFRPSRLPNQINLRNLHIQQIKYATISDIVLYTRNGVSPGTLEIAEAIAHAQDELYQQRMDEFYQHVAGHRGEGGEGIDRPVKYGVWVLVEPFSKVERFCPHLVNINSQGVQTNNSRVVDLFEREAYESRAMTRATEVIEGFWVGNDTDVPGGADDGAGATVPFDLCVKASECSDMPLTTALASVYRSLGTLDRMRHQQQQQQQQQPEALSSWTMSPATQALRSLLSPGSTPQGEPPSAASQLGTSPDETSAYSQQHAAQHHYISIECAGSCRTITGQMRNLATMTEKVIELVSFLRKLVEGKDKTGTKRKVLVHCQDGYTESSIIVLSYIMAALGLSLPEAYLYFQLEAKRSFFLYPTDRPLLHRIEARLAQDRRDRAMKTARAVNNAAPTPAPASTPASPTSRWKPWGFIRGSPVEDKDKLREREREREERNARSVEAARRLLIEEGCGGSQVAQEARIWFEDKRFDGFPSRILPFLYLGNLEHAGNAAMLKALGITHVVSVGESLLDVPPEHDPLHGYIGPNTLGVAARAGQIQVLDLTDVRDDGNDPLRPLIARACEWMEQARAAGGSVLVHCRVGVSRSASIVVSKRSSTFPLTIRWRTS
jgi:dual specificity MAP kinase phosphatase